MALHSSVAVLLAAALLVMCNYLAFRHYHRADWSRMQYYALTDKTRSLLASLTNTVHVAVFFQAGHELFEDVDNLLREYEFTAGPRLHIERVDPDRNLAQAEALARRYHVDQVNVVVFDCDGRMKVVTVDDLAQYDYSALPYGGRPVKQAFLGEQAFSSAILSVTQARQPVLYALTGHGERSIEDFDPRRGFSRIAQQIRQDNIELRTLALGETGSIPDDADALLLANPQKPLAPAERNMLRDYLDQKGRLLLLLDALTDHGLTPLLVSWGVRVADDVVVDATRTLSGRELFVHEFGDHPITARLENTAVVFLLPRSVEPIDETVDGADVADRPRVTGLAACSESGWADTTPEESPLRFDPARDTPGPVFVAVAVEKAPPPEAGVTIPPTRMVVIGDADFVANGGLAGANADFFLSALNWLLEREQLLSISPKPAALNRLVLDRRQLRMVFWLAVVVLPLAVATIGSLVWIRRRR